MLWLKELKKIEASIATQEAEGVAAQISKADSAVQGKVKLFISTSSSVGETGIERIFSSELTRIPTLK